MIRNLRLTLLATGIVLALSTLSLAHDEHDVAQRASRQGYSDGYQHGREDRDRGLGYDYQSDDYRRGDRGYDQDYGDRGQFAAAYREGYRAGYDDGYNGRNGRFDDAYDRGDYGRDGRHGHGRYGSNDVAYENGYRDGIDGARSDISKNKRPGPNDHGWYRNADHGYFRGYGNKEAYRQQYRRGYEDGYQDGFAQRSPGYGDGRYGDDRRGDSDVAYSNGYQDGIVGARKDMTDRNSSDPTRHDWYKEANRGYDGRYGSPQDYKLRYRQGYVAGYNDTYRRWW